MVVRRGIQYRKEFGILVDNERHFVAIGIHAVRLHALHHPQIISHNLYRCFSLLQTPAVMLALDNSNDLPLQLHIM